MQNNATTTVLVSLATGITTALVTDPRVALVLCSLFVLVYVTERCVELLLVTRASERTFRRAIELRHGSLAPAPTSEKKAKTKR